MGETVNLFVLFRACAVALVLLLIGAVVVAVPQRAEALTGSEFDPGYIISDSQFYTRDAMSQEQIQKFLDAKIGACTNSLCLNILKVDTPTTTLGFGKCDTYFGEAGESAARIIYKVQQACGISAKVILATLQKEQGLVEGRIAKAPTSAVLRKAMGQGCPDTAQCDSAFYGFFMQVLTGVRQLGWYGDPAGSHTSIKVGQKNAVRYSPDSTCGSSEVVIANRATASLYYYTPYQPNAAALANLGGTGNACSSYGNRNFWVYYSNWFGSPTASRNPIGGFDVTPVFGAINLGGWAIDRDTTGAVRIDVYSDGRGLTSFPADSSRPDVGAAYPGYGDNHGIQRTVPVAAGAHEICVYAINVGVGSNTSFGCRTVQVSQASPFGDTKTTVVPGGVQLRGWTIDPETVAPLDVHVYIDGRGQSIKADKSRPDVGRTYPGYGDNHGIDQRFDLVPGKHSVCAFGINVGQGGNTLLGCQDVTVPAGSPFGGTDVTVVPGGVQLRGWTIDPETAAPLDVHVYIDGRGQSIKADKSRPDVGRIFAGYGDNHGIDQRFDLAPGKHSVCAFGINVGQGGNTLLGCYDVTVPGGSPFGGTDVTVVPGGVQLRGWTIDPETAAALDVHVYIDGRGQAIKADKSRPDVGRIFAGYGDNHGIDQRFDLVPGKHSVCAFGINVGQGGNTLLACYDVIVP